MCSFSISIHQSFPLRVEIVEIVFEIIKAVCNFQIITVTFLACGHRPDFPHLTILNPIYRMIRADSSGLLTIQGYAYMVAEIFRNDSRLTIGNNLATYTSRNPVMFLNIFTIHVSTYSCLEERPSSCQYCVLLPLPAS